MSTLDVEIENLEIELARAENRKSFYTKIVTGLTKQLEEKKNLRGDK